MNAKDSLAIFGLLTSISGVYYNGQEIKISNNYVPTLLDALQYDETYSYSHHLQYMILEYLHNLKLNYSFVRDLILNIYDSSFYHSELGPNSEPLPPNYNKRDLYQSEHDEQIWILDTGRIGIWCECDGFIAWLDEYETVWTLDTREEIKQRKELIKKELKKFLKTFPSTDSLFANLPKINENALNSKIKIAKFNIDLPEYKKGK